MVVVADSEDVFRIVDQQLQQTQLRDVGVLKFVDENVAIAILQRGAQRGFALQQCNGAGNERAKRRAFLFTQQLFARAVRTGDLVFAGDGFLALGERIGIKLIALGVQLDSERVGI